MCGAKDKVLSFKVLNAKVQSVLSTKCYLRGRRKTKRLSGFHSLSDLPSFVLSHSPSSLRFTSNTCGLPSRPLYMECHPWLHPLKAVCRSRSCIAGVAKSLGSRTTRSSNPPALHTKYHQLLFSYTLREKPWSPTLSAYGYLAGSRKP